MESPPIRRARDRLPWLLNKLGADPAHGSGPLATIIQDVLSLIIYFAIVSSIVV